MRLDPLQRLSVRTQIALLAAGLVLLSVSAGTPVLWVSATRAVEQELGRRALHVGQTVAAMTQVQANVSQPGGEQVIQPIAERLRVINDVAYVVVLDMAHRRLSHPVESRIGTLFTGGDEGPAFAEHTYVSRARGINGNSVRAFVPIMSTDGTEQIGVVVVGIMAPSFAATLRENRPALLGTLAAATVVGLIGAWLLGGRIRRQLLGLEPPVIARLLQERAAILDAVGEGLVAIDREERITVINDEARRMLGVGPEVVGRSIREVIPTTRLPGIMRSGEPEYNQENIIGSRMILANRVPVRLGGEIVGAVSTFRDRTEVNRLAEELTGVTKFVDALRAQNHEHLNRLHTIAGLVQLGKYDQAVDYIVSMAERQQDLARFLARHFCDHRIGGLLLGKVYRARELGLTLDIDRRSHLDRLPPRVDAGALVVVLGNLLENAMEAAAGTGLPRRRVYCRLHDTDTGLLLEIRDNGPGIAPEIQADIWNPGFSTRGGEHRGFGLALVRQHVHSAGGNIELDTGPRGTRVRVWLPMGRGRRSRTAAARTGKE